MKLEVRFQNHIPDFKTFAQKKKETIKRYQFINDVLKVGLKIDTSITRLPKQTRSRTYSQNMG
jgi:hypothetical protein